MSGQRSAMALDRAPGGLLGLTLVLLLMLCLLSSAQRPSAAAPPVGSATPWGRDYFPNTLLTDQDGQTLRFFDDLIAGKVVVINFIFTGCGDSCPLETARLRQVQKLLGERVGQDIFFYSISIDPLSDTPAVLKQYAERFKVGPGWRFLTGDVEQITELRHKLGLFIDGVDNGRNKDHNLSLIIGNQASGRWMKASPFENPWILVDQLANTLHNWKEPSTEQSYADAPPIRPPSTGEELFRTRCASCHSLGPQDGQGLGLRDIGPDLLGVTGQRDPDWLRRWIKEPDRLLKEQDPLAVELFARYNRVPMPNLRLDDTSVTAILDFLQAESQRQQPSVGAMATGGGGGGTRPDPGGPGAAGVQ